MRRSEIQSTDDPRNLPNFLVAGCPRCGTTSLYNYLRQHPDIFMSAVKEPGFLTEPFAAHPPPEAGDKVYARRFMRHFEDYAALFNGHQGEHAIGEATPHIYYYGQKAVARVREFLGDPKLILILRNPVDRAFSAYWLNRRNGVEKLSFEDALAKEPQRMKDGWPHPWLYADVGRYAAKIEILFESFSEVKLCLFDDLQQQPARLMEELFCFLGVDPAFQPRCDTVYNPGGAPRSDLLNRLFLWKSPTQELIRKAGSRLMGAGRWDTLRERARGRNSRPVEMSPSTRRALTERLREDNTRLQALIGRDLTHWVEHASDRERSTA